MEISTPHFNDRVRLDSDKDNLLLSTEPQDVYEITSHICLSHLERFGFLPIDFQASLNILNYFISMEQNLLTLSRLTLAGEFGHLSESQLEIKLVGRIIR